VGEDARVITIDDLSLAQKKKITLGIFVILFFIRIIGSFKPKFAQESMEISFLLFYISITFTLLTVVIWLNKENLSDLNIDRYFIMVLILTGVLLFLYFGISPLGIVAGISALSLFYLLKSNKLQAEKAQKPTTLLIITLIGITPVVLLRLLSHELSFYIEGFHKLSEIELMWFVVRYTWGVAYEEMLFRGMLWMILRDEKIYSSLIIFIQAFLFWIIHANSVSGFSFWIILPMVSLWFGFLVRRSKSLIPSTMAHFLYNITIEFMKANL
jgi:membrane protease YdiL (CAAX protease family)